MTRKNGGPFLTVVNTNSTGIGGSYDFYGYDDSGPTHGAENYIKPKTCTFNPCTESPFTGNCYASASEKQGVLCDYDSSIACAAGLYKQIVDNAIALPPPENACAASKPEWDCNRNSGIFKSTEDCQLGDEVSGSRAASERCAFALDRALATIPVY